MNREIIQNMVKLELDKQLQALGLDKSKPINVSFKIINKDIRTSLPEYKTSGSSGMDIKSSEHVMINPGQTVAVGTNISVEIPDGYEIQVRPRSGLALKESITVLNSPGTIDSDYRGEIKVILHNAHPEKSFEVMYMDRIAQLVLVKVEKMNVVYKEELSETVRGEGGFGHTGINDGVNNSDGVSGVTGAQNTNNYEDTVDFLFDNRFKNPPFKNRTTNK